MDRSPIYDSVFKTMAEKMPELLVPLVNEAFGTAYPEDAPVTRLGGGTCRKAEEDCRCGLPHRGQDLPYRVPELVGPAYGHEDG